MRGCCTTRRDLNVQAVNFDETTFAKVAMITAGGKFAGKVAILRSCATAEPAAATAAAAATRYLRMFPPEKRLRCVYVRAD